MPRETSPALYERFYLELMQASLLIQRRLSIVLKRHGLTIAEHALLRVVEHHPGIAAADIARRLSMTPSAVTQMLNACARKEFVRRTADHSDARRTTLQLTAAGRTAVQRSKRSIAEFLEESGVSPRLYASLTGQLLEFTNVFGAQSAGDS